MRTVFLIVCSLALTSSVFSQERAVIEGYVTDSLGRPVAGATVMASMVDHSPKVSAVTGADGRYRVTVAPRSIYTVAVTITRNGRTETIASATGSLSLNPGEVRELNFEVDAAPVIFERVQVSAGASQPLEQISKTVDVISGAQMRERADFTLVDTLRTIPGFRIQQSGGFGRLATIKTRGLRNQDTAVLIDGIRFRDPTAIAGDASPFLSDLTLTSVDEIEVLRGSGSSVYGTNAIGGVIDFQTPRARLGTHGQVAGAFGGLGLGRFRGLISHAGENFGVGGGLSRTVYTKGIDGQDDAHNTNFQTRFDVTPTPRTSFSGRTFFSNADVRLNVNPDTLGALPANTATIIDARAGVNFAPDANDPDSLQRSRFFTGQFAASHIFSNEFVVSGHYQGLGTRRENTDGTLGPGFQSASRSLFTGRIHTANAHVDWTPRNNTFTAGYEFEDELFRNDNTFSGEDSSSRASQRSGTFYVQNLLSLDDGRLNIAGGFRFQTFDLGRPTFLGNAPAVLTQTVNDPPSARTFDGAFSYFFRGTGTKLRAHVGNGYRVPSLYERFGSYRFFGTVFPLGNPTLKPERSIGLDGGIEQPLAKNRVRLTATYFYTRIKDEITYIPTDNFNESAYYNFDRHYSRGAELSASANVSDSTSAFASYTYTNSDVRAFRRPTFPVGPVFSNERKAFGVPDHQFTLVVTQRFARAWVNFDFLATSSYLAQIFSNSTFNTYIYRFAGNRRGDLTAGYTFAVGKSVRTLRLYGTIENLFDQEYYENGFRTIRRTGRIAATFGF